MHCLNLARLTILPGGCTKTYTLKLFSNKQTFFMKPSQTMNKILLMDMWYFGWDISLRYYIGICLHFCIYLWQHSYRNFVYFYICICIYRDTCTLLFCLLYNFWHNFYIEIESSFRFKLFSDSTSVSWQFPFPFKELYYRTAKILLTLNIAKLLILPQAFPRLFHFLWFYEWKAFNVKIHAC